MKYESPITYHSKDKVNVKVFADRQTDRQTDGQAKNYMLPIFRYGGIKMTRVNILWKSLLSFTPAPTSHSRIQTCDTLITTAPCERLISRNYNNTQLISALPNSHFWPPNPLIYCVYWCVGRLTVQCNKLASDWTCDPSGFMEFDPVTKRYLYPDKYIKMIP
jgi:hypothetical protein